MRSGYGTQAFAIHRFTIEHFAYMYALLSGVLSVEKAEQQNEFDMARVSKALEVTRKRDVLRGRKVVTADKAEALVEFNKTKEVTEATDHKLSIYDLLDEPDPKFIHDQYRLLSAPAAYANLVS